MSVIVSPVIGVASLFIVVSVSTGLDTANQSLTIFKHRNFTDSMLATTQSLNYQMRDKSGSFKWKEVQGIVLNGNDVYIHGIAIDSGFYIPHTAFTSSEAAKRFHASLFALWKSNGNPDAVSAEVRAEFAPLRS